MPTIPAHNLKAGARARLFSSLSAGVEALFLSGQYLRGDEANLLAPLPSQFRFGVDAAYGLGARCLLFAKVTNVFGRHDVDFGQVASARPVLDVDDSRFVSPSAPRLIRAGVRVLF